MKLEPLAGAPRGTANNMFKISIPGTPVMIKYSEVHNTFEFDCDCGSSEKCFHVEDVQANRKDAEFFYDSGLFIKDKPVYVGVPILVAPIVTYWVQLEELANEPGFILVKHPQIIWHEHMVATAPKMSICKDVANWAVKSLPFYEELCMITEGEGIGDITSSVFDSFSAFHLQYNPPYQCLATWHRSDNAKEMRDRIADPATKPLELARIFFTDSCTACARPARPDNFDDLIPRGHAQAGDPAAARMTRTALSSLGKIKLAGDDGTSHAEIVDILRRERR